jgi:hypothetical protein
MRSSHRPLSCFFLDRWLHLRGGVDETEDVVEDVVGAVCGQKLESLSVAHRPALLLDLCDCLSELLLLSSLPCLFRQAQTHQKGTADDDEDTALRVAGLRVDGCDLVLDALERKLLCSHDRISLSCRLLCHDVSSLLFAILVGAFLW